MRNTNRNRRRCSSLAVDDEEEEFTGVDLTLSSPPHQLTVDQERQWIQAQESLKLRLILTDDSPPPAITYIGGVDLSFSRSDPTLACAALVVVDARTLAVVHHELRLTRLRAPYAPGFLAFREAPPLLRLLDRMRRGPAAPLYPHLLLVDGNGMLHPRGFGLACHLGVSAGLPAVGVAKNLHCVEGVSERGVRELMGEGDVMNIVGESGRTLGAAVRSTPGCLKPVYVSVGHRISLDSAVRIVKSCCRFRVPEPIRQADIRSREHIQRFT